MKNLFLSLILFLFPTLLFAQVPETIEAEPDFRKAEVLEILDTSYPLVFGREIEFQTLLIEFSDKTTSDEVFNDYTPVKVGDTIYVGKGYNPETESTGYFVREIDRGFSVFVLFVFFTVVYLLIAGIKGLRSLFALGFSIAAVWFVLIPLVISGMDPLLVGAGVSVFILGFAIFITHGFNIVSYASYSGSLISIFLTIIFAKIAFPFARISGNVGEGGGTISALYGPTVDLSSLLLASIIIGILGVLDDVAVMQSAMVREFMYEKKYSLAQIFKKAMRVGREHAAALVNTLVLAYLAVSLPLFLIVLAPSGSYLGEGVTLGMQLSNELFMTEIIRSILGSFGLVITIPIVTALAILMFKKYPPKEPREGHHHHGHSH